MVSKTGDVDEARGMSRIVTQVLALEPQAKKEQDYVSHTLQLKGTFPPRIIRPLGQAIYLLDCCLRKLVVAGEDLKCLDRIDSHPEALRYWFQYGDAWMRMLWMS